MAKAIVTLAEGQTDVVRVSKTNPENGSIMVKSETVTMNDNGFEVEEVRIGFIKGTIENLRKRNLKPGDDYSAKVTPVKLVIKEQFEPFFPGQEPKKNPKTDEVITSSGATVYRYTFVVSETSPMVDEKTRDVLVIIEVFKEVDSDGLRMKYNIRDGKLNHKKKA